MSAFEDFIQVELPRRPWVVLDPAQESIPVRRGAGPRQLEFVSLNDGEVLGQVAGVVQGVVVPGLGGGDVVPKNYIHIQSVASDTWNINHGLASDDYIAFVVDSAGKQIIPDNIDRVDANNITVELNTPIIGRAVIIFAS